jgi:hypothetical protein
MQPELTVEAEAYTASRWPEPESHVVIARSVSLALTRERHVGATPRA